MMYGLAPAVDQYVNSADNGTRRAFIATTAFLEYMVAMLEVQKANGYNDTVFFSGVPELSNIYEIYRQLPDLIESVVITSLREPEKVSNEAFSLTALPNR